MATVNPTVTKLADDTVVKFTWANMANGDVGAPVHRMWAGHSDRSVQFQGTFGTGGSVTLKGTNDSTNYVALTDPQGNAITKTAPAALEQVMEQAVNMRPEVTAGDGTTAITVTLVCRLPVQRKG